MYFCAKKWLAHEPRKAEKPRKRPSPQGALGEALALLLLSRSSFGCKLDTMTGS